MWPTPSTNRDPRYPRVLQSRLHRRALTPGPVRRRAPDIGRDPRPPRLDRIGCLTRCSNPPLVNARLGGRLLGKAEPLAAQTGSVQFSGRPQHAWSQFDAEQARRRRRHLVVGTHAQGVASAAQKSRHPGAIGPCRLYAPATKIANDPPRLTAREVVLYDRESPEQREAIGARISQDRCATCRAL